VQLTTADLAPGDVLYVPPYHFHTVETIDASVSLTTWSHDAEVYGHMAAVYDSQLTFDKLADPRGRVFALRLFVDMLAYEVVGYNRTKEMVDELRHTRYASLETMLRPEAARSLFGDGTCGGGAARRGASAGGPQLAAEGRADDAGDRAATDDASADAAGVRPEDGTGVGAAEMIPTSRSVWEDVDLDVGIVGRHFKRLPPVVRDWLLHDFVEEVSANILGGADLVPPFLRNCFRGQGYRMTEKGTQEHRLWRHKTGDE
jgi:hypothetical protein